MANVNTETTIQLSAEEKELLEKAIKKMEEIAEYIRCDTDLFVDADCIFACIDEAYRHNDKKIPTIVHIWE